MLTHHASNGCNLANRRFNGFRERFQAKKRRTWLFIRINLAWQRTNRIAERRNPQILEDYDEIIMKGYCEREGFRRIGFGECRGMVLPAD